MKFFSPFSKDVFTYFSEKERAQQGEAKEGGERNSS